MDNSVDANNSLRSQIASGTIESNVTEQSAIQLLSEEVIMSCLRLYFGCIEFNVIPLHTIRISAVVSTFHKADINMNSLKLWLKVDLLLSVAEVC